MRLAALLLLLAGCASGVKPYAAGGDRNLSIRTSSSARASLDVHSVDAQCRTQYLGSVALDRPDLALGIPAGRPSYLEFGFASSGFFSKSTHASRGTLIDPKPGARYEIDVTYRDDLYNVAAREIPPRGARAAAPRSRLLPTARAEVTKTAYDRAMKDNLEELNRHYVRAVQESDARWFDEHLAEDFLNTNPDGSLLDRAGFLAQIARPAGVKNLECHDVRIRKMGDFAIIHATTSYLRGDGQPGKGRYTDIWARKGGRWLCVAAHVTRG